MARSVKPSVRMGRMDIPGFPGSRLATLCDDAHNLRVTVAPDDGGEIASIQYRHEGQWRELLYRGLDYSAKPPLGWPGRAPLLWPTVGRSCTPAQMKRWALTGRAPTTAEILVKGKAYRIGMHGFVRSLPWTLETTGADEHGAFAVCSIASCAETRKRYPYDFRLRVKHSLARLEIVSLYEVCAGNNRGPMPFCIGNHIGFNMPFLGKGDYFTCTARTPGRIWNELGNGTTTGRTKPVNYMGGVPLGAGMYGDQFITGYRRGNAWGEVSAPGLTVRVTQAEKPVNGRCLADERDYAFVFWGKPENNQICPEPWIGIPNALNLGRGLIRLEPNSRFLWEMRVKFMPE